VLDAPADIVSSSLHELHAVSAVRLENVTTGEPAARSGSFRRQLRRASRRSRRSKNELPGSRRSPRAARRNGSRAAVTFEKTLPDSEKLERLRKLLEVPPLETEARERARVKREQT